MGGRDWNRDDLDFDEDGRLVIKNEALKRKIREHLKDRWSLMITTDPRRPLIPMPPVLTRCPEPPDVMCGCLVFRVGEWPVLERGREDQPAKPVTGQAAKPVTGQAARPRAGQAAKPRVKPRLRP